MTSKYLLEIGVEELPSNQIESAILQLKTSVLEMLAEHNISNAGIQSYATPRRLTIIIENIQRVQETIKEEVKGPNKKIAFGEDGQPSKALLGFMSSQGIGQEDLKVKEIKGVEYIFADVEKIGKKVEDILREVIPLAIRSIVFPKSMRWGGKNLRFSRPIRWIVSMLDEEVVPFDLENIKVSNETFGHRFLHKGIVYINSVESYVESLNDAFVIVDPDERKDIIHYGAVKLAKEKGGNIEEDPELLNEIAYIVEYPTPLIGKIKQEYMSLPFEVITTPMKEHQRYFPVVDDDGKLLPYFITVRNGSDEHIEIVTHGNEMVLEPRLEDAKFFYEEDLKKSLSEYRDELKKLTFQEKLGNMFEKTERLILLSQKYASYLSLGDETMQHIIRAAELSKADLVTKMVYEFTELQGKMGRIYAIHSGENEMVAQAIDEQYLPRFSGDQLPSTTAGTVLSLTDKFDTICGMFAVGIKPTGSEDPFALRRAALGIINIILDKSIEIKISDFVSDALYVYVDQAGLVFNYNEVQDSIMSFFAGRFKNMLIDEGIRHDVVESLAELPESINTLYVRAQYLDKKISSDAFKKAIEGYRRIESLATKADQIDWSLDILEENDKNLLASYQKISSGVEEYIVNKEYDAGLELLAEFSTPINAYMNEVMVMVDNEELKKSRLGLLKAIKKTYNLLCDFSRIVMN